MPKVLRVLPDEILALLSAGRGMFSTRAATTAGISGDHLRRLVKAGLLVRVNYGHYVAASNYENSSAWDRHRHEARAFAGACEGAYVTGVSAAALWRMPTVGRPPRRPAVVRPKVAGCGGTVTPHGFIRVAELPRSHRWRIGLTRVVSRAWAAVDTARSVPPRHGLIVADAAARAGADLEEVVDLMRGWPGIIRARWVAEHADACAESPIESLGRFTCLEFRLPLPVSNAWVGLEGPRFRVDGLWPYHWAANEADGALKYDNRPDAGRIITAQNDREWYLRRLGLDLVRYDWDLVWRRRRELADRFAALLRDNPVRSVPIRWWKHVPGVGPVVPEPSDWPSPRPLLGTLPPGGSAEAANE
jgi:hypothetical protein